MIYWGRIERFTMILASHGPLPEDLNRCFRIVAWVGPTFNQFDCFAKCSIISTESNHDFLCRAVDSCHQLDLLVSLQNIILIDAGCINEDWTCLSIAYQLLDGVEKILTYGQRGTYVIKVYL